jgi:hypothetical protein
MHNALGSIFSTKEKKEEEKGKKEVPKVTGKHSKQHLLNE